MDYLMRKFIFLGEIMSYKDHGMLTFTICWILVQVHSREVYNQTYCYHITMKSCEAGVEKKDKLKGQTRSRDCEEQAYVHVHPEAADASHVRCFHANQPRKQHLKSPVILETDGKPRVTRLSE